jgi:hypothetical protein
MYGATASAGVGVLVAPTGNLNDLSGDFSTYGASAGFGPWAGADLAVPDSGSDIYSLSVKGGAGFDINPLGPFEVHGGWGKTGVLAIGINDVSDWIEQTFFAAGGGGGF